MHKKWNKELVFISTKPWGRKSYLRTAALPPAWEISKKRMKAGHDPASSAHAE